MKKLKSRVIGSHSAPLAAACAVIASPPKISALLAPTPAAALRLMNDLRVRRLGVSSFCIVFSLGFSHTLTPGGGGVASLICEQPPFSPMYDAKPRFPRPFRQKQIPSNRAALIKTTSAGASPLPGRITMTMAIRTSTLPTTLAETISTAMMAENSSTSPPNQGSKTAPPEWPSPGETTIGTATWTSTSAICSLPPATASLSRSNLNRMPHRKFVKDFNDSPAEAL